MNLTSVMAEVVFIAECSMVPAGATYWNSTGPTTQNSVDSSTALATVCAAAGDRASNTGRRCARSPGTRGRRVHRLARGCSPLESVAGHRGWGAVFCHWPSHCGGHVARIADTNENSLIQAGNRWDVRNKKFARISFLNVWYFGDPRQDQLRRLMLMDWGLAWGAAAPNCTIACWSAFSSTGWSLTNSGPISARSKRASRAKTSL